MTNPITDIIKVNLLFPGKDPHLPVQLRYTFQRAGCTMVNDHGDAGRVKHFAGLHLLKSFDCQRRCTILPHNKIQISNYDIICFGIPPALLRKYFFSNRSYPILYPLSFK
jgi:hypothetical protein